MNLKPVIHRILQDYALPWHGTHGVGHWARVLENGLRLAKATEANIQVVQLFAIFHDSRRVNECTDCGHGKRGGDLALSLRGKWFVLSDEEFDLLYRACAGHTDGQTDADITNITIQTCWDSDRLDLGRVGICPNPRKLCTKAAKHSEMLKWTDGRACFEVVPELVKADWGIDTSDWKNH